MGKDSLGWRWAKSDFGLSMRGLVELGSIVVEALGYIA